MSDRTQFYVFCEDLASALIGPFEDRNSASDHVQMILRHGGSDSNPRVVDDIEAAVLRGVKQPLEVTAEDDAQAWADSEMDEADADADYCEWCGADSRGRCRCHADTTESDYYEALSDKYEMFRNEY